jgi:hypothetical protein
MHAPKVTEATVALTAFTEEGVRVPVLCRVGTTLAETLRNSTELLLRMPSAVTTRSASGEAEGHVTLSEEHVWLVPPLSASDKEWLEFEAADGAVGDGSRLTSKIGS